MHTNFGKRAQSEAGIRKTFAPFERVNAIYKLFSRELERVNDKTRDDA